MDNYREILLAYEQEVLKNIPNPFGSFEKARYELCCYPNSIPHYSFVTTSRNTEECVEIMKEKFKGVLHKSCTCIVYKIQGGKRIVVYTDKIGYDA